MAQTTSPPSPSSLVPSHWIARVLIAVLLAEGIWGLIVSLTRDLLVPFLAQQMGGDPQSPLYLGKGVYDFPAVFIALLELCFAGIVAAALNAWVSHRPRAPRLKTVTVRKVVVKSAASPPLRPLPGSLSILAPAPVAEPARTPVIPPPTPIPQVSPAPVAPPPAAPKPAAPQKPAKPQKPKEVYYNLVGEPINPTEDD